MSKGARLRKAAGLTKEQLAERSGLNQQQITDLERGRRNPTVVTLYEFGRGAGGLGTIVQNALARSPH